MIRQYNPKLKEHARELRKNSTLAEVLLWNVLKGKKLRSYQFNRQKPVGEYIVDFFCPALNLAIEIDGYSHIGKEGKDKARQRYLELIGLNVVRFTDEEVKGNTDGVATEIERVILEIERK